MSWCPTTKCLATRNSPLAPAMGRAHALSGPQDAMSVPLICDFGSGSSKVGFAGAEGPLAVFPTVLGKLRHDDDDLVGLDKKVWFIGDEVQKQREKLNLVYPMSRAEVTNWDHMEKIWHHSFYQVLRVAPEQHPMLLTEPPSNSKASKERTAQVLFETFSVPALYIVNQGVLSLFSSGLTSGTTIECGEGMTHFVPIIEGCPLHLSTMQMDVAGQDITLYLMQLLSRRGNSLLGTGDREYIRDMKEKCCYVALDFDKEKAAALSVALVQKHQLPDGREIEFGPEQFLCMEALFQPDFIGRSSLGAHMIALRSISSCSPDLHRPLFRNVLLSGGTGSSPSLRARMQRELSALVSPTTNVKVSTCPCSVYSAWVGGSVLCSLSTFKDMWVTSDDYNEKGPSAVSKRSF
ncbi:actin [Eptesicus fuscus]|uniref:actin n=1 Tax=Eptesicus fuscus TaxID=29078 RepID=UPI002404887C|nr:actin [Eptesicus fuscus]